MDKYHDCHGNRLGIGDIVEVRGYECHTYVICKLLSFGIETPGGVFIPFTWSKAGDDAGGNYFMGYDEDGFEVIKV